jgi:hypothetical protein
LKHLRALRGDLDRAVADNRYLGSARIVWLRCRHVMISSPQPPRAADGGGTAVTAGRGVADGDEAFSANPLHERHAEGAW